MACDNCNSEVASLEAKIDSYKEKIRELEASLSKLLKEHETQKQLESK